MNWARQTRTRVTQRFPSMVWCSGALIGPGR
jgi:hypothetical protein